MNKREVRITGSYAALAQVVAGNPDDFIESAHAANRYDNVISPLRSQKCSDLL